MSVDPDSLEITPGVGVGKLRFGQTPEAVREILGEPSEVAQERFEEIDTLSWHFDASSLSLHFEREETASGEANTNWELCAIDIAALETSVFGVRPLGLAFREAEAVFEDHARLVRDAASSSAEREAYVLVPRVRCGGEVVLWFGKHGCDSLELSAETEFELELDTTTDDGIAGEASETDETDVST